MFLDGRHAVAYLSKLRIILFYEIFHFLKRLVIFERKDRVDRSQTPVVAGL